MRRFDSCPAYELYIGSPTERITNGVLRSGCILIHTVVFLLSWLITGIGWAMKLEQGPLRDASRHEQRGKMDGMCSEPAGMGILQRVRLPAYRDEKHRIYVG